MQQDKSLIIAIKNNQNWAIRSIYKTQYPSIKKMVYSFKNIVLEPDDIFQEGLTRTIINIREGKFKGESSLSTYLNAVCKNICLKVLSRSKIQIPTQEDKFIEYEEDNHYEILNFVNEIKQKLNEGCRKIIDLRFNQTRENVLESPSNKLRGFEQIANHLKISVENARQRFKRCMDQLRDMVFNHPEYNSLFE